MVWTSCCSKKPIPLGFNGCFKSTKAGCWFLRKIKEEIKRFLHSFFFRFLVFFHRKKLCKCFLCSKYFISIGSENQTSLLGRRFQAPPRTRRSDIRFLFFINKTFCLFGAINIHSCVSEKTGAPHTGGEPVATHVQEREDVERPSVHLLSHSTRQRRWTSAAAAAIDTAPPFRKDSPVCAQWWWATGPSRWPSSPRLAAGWQWWGGWCWARLDRWTASAWRRSTSSGSWGKAWRSSNKAFFREKSLRTTAGTRPKERINTRWSLPTAGRRARRRPATPRWRNGWSTSSNACPGPTAGQTSAVSRLSGGRRRPAFYQLYLEGDGEDQHGEDQRPERPVSKHLQAKGRNTRHFTSSPTAAQLWRGFFVREFMTGNQSDGRRFTDLWRRHWKRWRILGTFANTKSYKLKQEKG